MQSFLCDSKPTEMSCAGLGLSPPPHSLILLFCPWLWWEGGGTILQGLSLVGSQWVLHSSPPWGPLPHLSGHAGCEVLSLTIAQGWRAAPELARREGWVFGKQGWGPGEGRIAEPQARGGGRVPLPARVESVGRTPRGSWVDYTSVSVSDICSQSCLSGLTVSPEGWDSVFLTSCLVPATLSALNK